MKKQFLFIALLSSFACSSLGVAVKVSGTIDHAQGESIILTTDKYFLGQKLATHETSTGNGRFEISVDIDHYDIAELRFKNDRMKIYLEPGFDLEVLFTADLMSNTVHFAGKGAAENLFLGNFLSKFSDHFNDSMMYAKMMSE